MSGAKKHKDRSHKSHARNDYGKRWFFAKSENLANIKRQAKLSLQMGGDDKAVAE